MIGWNLVRVPRVMELKSQTPVRCLKYVVIVLDVCPMYVYVFSMFCHLVHCASV